MGCRVLVVCEADAASSIRSIIEKAGHEVVGIAEGCEDAIELASQMHPDVSLVDMESPSVSGIDTTHRLIELGVEAVMIMSTQVDKEWIESAALAGACTYVRKPVDQESLCANIELVCARASVLAALRKEAEDVMVALETRKLSERAKHILMSRLSLNEEDAFTYLRHKCRNQNKTMRQAADEIIIADEAFLRAIENEPPKKG
ncbi:response regulator [bacterium]|nr:response regulator [bacterium]